MGCAACGGGRTTARVFIVTNDKGEQRSYETEREARAALKRTPGGYMTIQDK